MLKKRAKCFLFFRAKTTVWLKVLLVLLLFSPLIQNCSKQRVGPPQPLPELGLSSAQVKSKLIQHYNDWRGVPYRNGGQSRQGIDCSAFVQLTYKEQLRLNLPRTTNQQAYSGIQISTGGLRPGDLVLFKTGWGERHIGIYLERSNFMHVSTNRGVMVSSIAEPYWRKRFWQARRVFN